MKRAEIVVGQVYTNDKGRFRRVTAEGPQFRLYSGQTEFDCVEYEQWNVKKRAGKPDVAVQATEDVYYGSLRRDHLHFHSTRTSLASWAKRLATPEERQAPGLP